MRLHGSCKRFAWQRIIVRLLCSLRPLPCPRQCERQIDGDNMVCHVSFVTTRSVVVSRFVCNDTFCCSVTFRLHRHILSLTLHGCHVSFIPIYSIVDDSVTFRLHRHSLMKIKHNVASWFTTDSVKDITCSHVSCTPAHSDTRFAGHATFTPKHSSSSCRSSDGNSRLCDEGGSSRQ